METSPSEEPTINKLKLWLVLMPTMAAPGYVAAQNIGESRGVPEASLAAEPSYDSSRRGSPLPHIDRIAGAVVLGSETFSVVDGKGGTIYIVDASTGLVLADLSAEPEPLERPIRLLDQLPGGRLVAWRPQDGDFLKVYSSMGALEDSIPWLHGLGFGRPKPAGVLPDGTVISRTSGGSASIPGVTGGRDATVENTVRYEVQSAGGRLIVAEALVTDFATVTVPLGRGSSFQSTRMVFGDQVLFARSGTHLVIAPTGASAASVYDGAGALTDTIPIPGTRLPVSEALVTAQRYQRIAEARETGQTGQRMRLVAAAAEYMGRNYEPVNSDSLIILELPAKGTAPPIDRMLADPTGRIWFRLTVMPNDTHARWCVWDVSRREYSFWLALPRENSLLGAFPNSLLIQGTDDEGRPRILVTPFTVSGASERPATSTQVPCEKGQPA
ncbi:MAG: hypothetical protein OXJ54_13220 [Gemmatimonadetes bacterium]|nr:hypothetical protein [Candidatus Palauibacter rhopaloidicola]